MFAPGHNLPLRCLAARFLAVAFVVVQVLGGAMHAHHGEAAARPLSPGYHAATVPLTTEHRIVAPVEAVASSDACLACALALTPIGLPGPADLPLNPALRVCRANAPPARPASFLPPFCGLLPPGRAPPAPLLFAAS